MATIEEPFDPTVQCPSTDDARMHHANIQSHCLRCPCCKKLNPFFNPNWHTALSNDTHSQAPAATQATPKVKKETLPYHPKTHKRTTTKPSAAIDLTGFETSAGEESDTSEEEIKPKAETLSVSRRASPNKRTPSTSTSQGSRKTKAASVVPPKFGTGQRFLNDPSHSRSKKQEG
jgi:hypothetical protein